MQIISVLFLFSALAAGEEQQPLREKAAAWFDKAKSYIPLAASVPAADPLAWMTDKLKVKEITAGNWRQMMIPTADDSTQEWMVLFSGNASCHGRCLQVDQAFNVGRPAKGPDIVPTPADAMN
jgi:hypothetical protein